MNVYFLILVECLASVSMSLIVLRTLFRPLTNVLMQICPGEQAAAFWTSYIKVMLMIAPLLLVLIVDMCSHFNDPVDALRLTLIAALGGILIALYAIGRRLGQFVNVPEQTGKTS